MATKSPHAETERLSIICMPSVARNSGANTWPGEQLACAVQVGRNPPASWYLAGGIRIGVQESTGSVYQLNASRLSAPIRMCPL